MRRRERELIEDRLTVPSGSESSGKLSRRSHRSEKVGAKAIGALAVGAVAIGALAIGALAIGRLTIGRTRIRRIEVDDLVVRRLYITEELQIPQKLEAEK
jgi:hypothetical protein